MRRAIRRESELRRRLGLSPAPVATRAAAADRFPTFVPLEFLRRIRPGDPDDPLLRQVLPVAEEDRVAPGDSADPVGDRQAVAPGGLLVKYEGRALLVSTGACGVHCRYCFRREFPYRQFASRKDRWREAIAYLRRRPEIDEVLLSGGDPLTLRDETLDDLLRQLEAVPHLRRIRIHTRMPVVIPQRVTPALVDRFAGTRLAPWFVIHANHPRELDEFVLRRLAMLVDRGIPVLNQAVLLRGVNDDAETLAELCLKLVNHRIQPYYLHQLDRVRGAAHFEVPEAEGLRLVERLRTRLPGYAVPQYVRELPGAGSKLPVVSGGGRDAGPSVGGNTAEGQPTTEGQASTEGRTTAGGPTTAGGQGIGVADVSV